MMVNAQKIKKKTVCVYRGPQWQQFETRSFFYIAPLPTNPLRHTLSYDIHTILITSVSQIIINHCVHADVCQCSRYDGHDGQLYNEG